MIASAAVQPELETNRQTLQTVTRHARTYNLDQKQSWTIQAVKIVHVLYIRASIVPIEHASNKQCVALFQNCFLAYNFDTLCRIQKKCEQTVDKRHYDSYSVLT